MRAASPAFGWMKGDRVIAVAVALGIALLLGESALRTLTPARTYGASDFIAFYCAGTVANAGRDPYRARPLADCETQVQDDIGATSGQRFAGVDPAPLPPATLVVFRGFARLPYVAAARLFTLCVALACLATVFILARTIALPWWAIAATIALGDYETNATTGQLAAFCLLASLLAGGALARGRPAFAGAIAPLALVQPNAALPILAALVLWVPRARLPAISGAALFCIAGLALGPASLTLEYVGAVVPAQAIAEVPSANQLSLTWLLWYLDVPDAAAVRLGEMSYAILAGAAVLSARRAATALGSDAAIVWLPAASVVAFGVYVHGNQLAYVVPLALLIAANARGTARATAVTGMLLVTVPFYGESRIVECDIAIVIVAVVLAVPAGAMRRRAALAAGGVAIAAAVVAGLPHLPLANRHAARDDLTPFLATQPNLGLASGILGVYDRVGELDSSLHALATKSPVWLGLGLLIVAAAAGLHAKGNQTRAEGG